MALVLDSEWFCRYTRLVINIHDNGTEFTGEGFQEMLESYGVKYQPTTVKKQSNAMNERSYLVMVEMLRTQSVHVPHKSTPMQEVQKVLQSVAFAL